MSGKETGPKTYSLDKPFDGLTFGNIRMICKGSHVVVSSNSVTSNVNRTPLLQVSWMPFQKCHEHEKSNTNAAIE
jgi:hypothetical protein